MRGPILFVVCLVAGAFTGALVLRPTTAPDAGDGALEVATLFPSPPEDAPPGNRVTVERSDALGPTAHACLVQGGCQLAVGDRRRLVPLVEPGEVERVELTIEWRPTTAATQRFLVELVECAPRWCSQQQSPLASASGVSPLLLSFTVDEDAALGMLTLRVSPDDLTPGPSEVYAAPQAQPFTITGTATFR